MKTPSGSRLDSWKVIAEYLGRNVRTVTRWADGRGLPIHRVPGGKRGAIFAFTAEIDAWLMQQKATESEPVTDGHREAHEESGVAHPGKSQESLRGGVLRWRLLFDWRVALPVVLVLLAGAGISIALRPASSHASEVFSIHYGADTLEARGAEGNTLWVQKYPKLISKTGFRVGPGEPGELDRSRIADFFGDGKGEVAAIVLLQSGPNPNDIVQPELDFFANTGKLLWRYLPQKTFQFGDYELGAPWYLTDLFVSANGNGRSLWAVASHHTWGNTFVVQLDPATGRDTLRFVNTGELRSLNEVKTSTGTYLLAAGFNNEWDTGSLAIINEDRAFAASPQTHGTRHECVSCPPGSPDYYFVFPRSEINRISGLPLDPVSDIRVNEDGILVRKYEHLNGGEENTAYLLRSEPPFSLLSVRYDSDYDILHRAWSSQGKIAHSLEECPERLHPQPVRLWTPAGGWTDLPVKPAKANQ